MRPISGPKYRHDITWRGVLCNHPPTNPLWRYIFHPFYGETAWQNRQYRLYIVVNIFHIWWGCLFEYKLVQSTYIPSNNEMKTIWDYKSLIWIRQISRIKHELWIWKCMTHMWIWLQSFCMLRVSLKLREYKVVNVSCRGGHQVWAKFYWYRNMYQHDAARMSKFVNFQKMGQMRGKKN